MREYWILTKLQLSSLYGVNKIRHAKNGEEKKRAKRSLTALIAMVLGLGWASTIYSIALGEALRAVGRLPMLIGLMAAAAGALVLLFSVFETKGVLFGFGDFDVVMSWPVRVSSVVAARVTVMYAYNLVYALLIMLPAGAVYAAYAKPAFVFYPMFLIGMLSVPALPTALGAVIGTLITMLTARMKKRNLVASVAQILLACGIMAISFGAGDSLDRFANGAERLGEGVCRAWPPAAWCMRAAQGDVPALLYGVAAAAAVLLALVRLLAKRFLVLNGRLTAAPGGKAFALAGYRQRRAGAVMALYRMEWRRYVGSTLYLANTAFGYVMMLAVAGVLGIVRPPVIHEIFADPAFPAMRSVIPLFLAMVACMSETTFASISIEGKRLWIVKSLPVRAKDWYLAKVLTSLTLAVPSILASALIMGLGMRFSASEWFFAIATPVAYALLSAAFGLFVNIRLPKLDWAAEAEIVKQSAASFICVFGGMFAAGIPIALLLTMNSTVVLPIATGAALALFALLFYGMGRGGDERLYRL